jgi:hypothetical protein
MALISQVLIPVTRHHPIEILVPVGSELGDVSIITNTDEALITVVDPNSNSAPYTVERCTLQFISSGVWYDPELWAYVGTVGNPALHVLKLRKASK